MKFYNYNGIELQDSEDVDYSKGRYLQDENDPDKYIFSPWDEVPLRDGETPPEASRLEQIEAQVMYTAVMTDTLMED